MFCRHLATFPRKRTTTGNLGAILAGVSRNLQTRLAYNLSKLESHLSVRQKKWALLLFCLGMSVLSINWIYQGLFSSNSRKPGFLNHQSITAPKKTALPDSLDVNLLREYQHWRAIKDSSLDSIKR